MKCYILLGGLLLAILSPAYSQNQSEMKEHNKSLVQTFYKEVLGNRNTDIIDSLISENYIQHSPMVKDGREGLREAINFLKQMPEPKEKKSPILFMMAEGEFVWVFLQVEMMGKKLAIMEIFRVEEGKLTEHWDATEEIQESFNKEDFRSYPLIEVSGFSTKALFPDRKIHRLLHDGNFVGIQSSGMIDGKAAVFYDLIMKGEQGVEKHWTVKQIIPEQMMHNNGML
ncbi:MAG: nuclear transport factor 2 family protein [Bacteroidota bacterium]